MFNQKVNKLDKEDVFIIMNIFNDIETIKHIGGEKYQIHLTVENYSSTLILTIKEKIITNISLLNSYNAK